jgi:multimeric flavodoxin WrbA
VKIVVFNGSPKGKLSVTLQYVLYIQKKFSQHQFQIFNVAQEINKIEKDEKFFQEIIQAVRSSDGILWAFPLYYFLVHASLKRFIELIWERGVQEAFKNKYAASLSTSIHFFDDTAHNYISSICEDLNMKYVDAFPAEMIDLLKDEERKKLIKFAEHFLNSMETKAPTSRNFLPLIYSKSSYVPGTVQNKVETTGKKILVLTDAKATDTNLTNMVQRLTQSFTQNIEVINLHDIDIRGGCLGCIQCGYDNTCVYQNKDGYIEFFNSKVKTADILIFTGTIRDRYLSSRWKLFFDRSFFHGHVPNFSGKQLGFIISGPFTQIPNLRKIFEAYTEVQGANPAGFVTDEYPTSCEIDALLQSMADRVIHYAIEGYRKPASFLGVGGTLVLTSNVKARLRPSFHADYIYYRKHKMFGYPRESPQMRFLSGLFVFLTMFPGLRKEFTRRTMAEMVKPLQNVVERG